MVDTLMDGHPERGRRRRRVRATIAHAMAFHTWYSLTREGGLTDDEAVEIMCVTVAAAS